MLAQRSAATEPALTLTCYTKGRGRQGGAASPPPCLGASHANRTRQRANGPTYPLAGFRAGRPRAGYALGCRFASVYHIFFFPNPLAALHNFKLCTPFFFPPQPQNPETWPGLMPFSTGDTATT